MGFFKRKKVTEVIEENKVADDMRVSPIVIYICKQFDNDKFTCDGSSEIHETKYRFERRDIIIRNGFNYSGWLTEILLGDIGDKRVQYLPNEKESNLIYEAIRKAKIRAQDKLKKEHDDKIIEFEKDIDAELYKFQCKLCDHKPFESQKELEEHIKEDYHYDKGQDLIGKSIIGQDGFIHYIVLKSEGGGIWFAKCSLCLLSQHFWEIWDGINPNKEFKCPDCFPS